MLIATDFDVAECDVLKFDVLNRAALAHVAEQTDVAAVGRVNRQAADGVVAREFAFRVVNAAVERALKAVIGAGADGREVFNLAEVDVRRELEELALEGVAIVDILRQFLQGSGRRNDIRFFFRCPAGHSVVSLPLLFPPIVYKIKSNSN